LNAKPPIEEVEQEFRAQIELAVKKIHNVTHLSIHMSTVMRSPEMTAVVEKLASEYNLPNSIPNVKWSGFLFEKSMNASEKTAALIEYLENLQPGFWIHVDHPGMNTPELRAVKNARNPDLGFSRYGVTKAWTSEEVKKIIERRGIQLVSYSDILQN